MAEVLWHELVTQKDSTDARDSSGNIFEHLASIKRVNLKTNKGCSFQMDRMTRNNLPEDRILKGQSLHKIILELFPQSKVNLKYNMPTYEAENGRQAIGKQKNYW